MCTGTATSPSCCSRSGSPSSSRKSCRSSGARPRSIFACRASLDFTAFTMFSTNYPAYKMFMLLTAVAIFAGAVRRAEAHPHRADHPGLADPSAHGRPCSATTCRRVFMLVFGVGTGLAAVAGVIAGPALVTQSNMAAAARPDPVRGRRGRRPGLARRRVHCLAADWAGPDLCGLDQPFGRRCAGRFRRRAPDRRRACSTSGTSPSRRSRRSFPICCWC